MLEGEEDLSMEIDPLDHTCVECTNDVDNDDEVGDFAFETASCSEEESDKFK